MARPPAASTPRDQRITVRFTRSEVAAIDQKRGALKPPDYIRNLVRKDAREDS